jgi:hypothetical protein
MRILGTGKAMSIPAAMVQMIPERIIEYFSPIREVYGPANNAPIAIVYRPIDRSPATKTVE